MIEDDDLRQQFAAESEEHLDAIERLLATPGEAIDRAAVDRLFRAFHSLKGMSGALGVGGMLAVAHRCEDILGLARQGSLVVAGTAADALVAAVDVMRAQRAALLDGAADLAAPEALLARLGALVEGGAVPAAPAAAPEPAAPSASHLPVLADVTRKVAAALAGRLAPGDVASATLAVELAALADAAGTARFARLLETLAGTSGTAALPLLGDVVRRLDALAAVIGAGAGAQELRDAIAARAGDGGLPADLEAIAARLEAAGAEQAHETALAARQAALVADALGLSALEALLLAIEDLWDRTAEPDAQAAAQAQRQTLAAQLRDAAAGGMSTLAAPPSAHGQAPAEPPAGPRVPPEFAPTLGVEGRRRLAEALSGGLLAYRVRLGVLATPEQEAAVLGWLSRQDAEVLASRVVPGSDPPTLELLVAAPPDARAFEASRSAFDPEGRLVGALIALGGAAAEGEAARAAAVATLRIRQDAVDGIIALQAEVRAAGLALGEAAEREAGRGLAGAIAALAEDLGPAAARDGAALAERVRRLLAGLQEAEARLSLSLRRLDEAMLELRVTPLSGVLGRMPRVARAVAQAAGKQVDIELTGGEVSIDRSLIELLADPLQHLVRNAVDHGVETPADRAASGKPPRAIIRIAAERSGADRVRITVADDGAGIDRAAVLRSAVARGLVTPTEAERLDEAGVHALLFRPGFSTREEVSETSGRGVGLDVVEDALHRAGGSVALTSRPGEGTRFALDLPLSAAMAPVLLVEAGGHAYALPAARVETVLHAGNLAEASRLHAIVSLEAALGMAAPEEAASIVVLRGSGGRVFGLAVGRVSRRTDLLLRPLHAALAALPGVGGVGVLGTGEPVVVLEPDGFLAD